MSSENEKWTPDRLQTPVGREIHLGQRRAQLHPIVDDLRRLAREMEAAVKEIKAIEGDLPGQARVRAWHVTRPLFKAANDVERALADLIAFNARYRSSYEDLPKKRADKRKQKDLAKGRQPQAIESSPAREAAAPPEEAEFGDVFDNLRKGA